MNGTATHRTVIVVGSGPTGLLLAGDLATAGVTVTLVEKRPREISNLSRAFGVHARTLEQLDARGLADELLTTGDTITGLRLFRRLSLGSEHAALAFPVPAHHPAVRGRAAPGAAGPGGWGRVRVRERGRGAAAG
ncbi:hypothetical protein GCM10010307_07650 [Streptomyces vastus]|uniref:FAD-binding domain-containing protein n=1 Tax=Streptomyces vastus TaxID=285451 RepID=A0ABN3QCH0_9ACTN